MRDQKNIVWSPTTFSPKYAFGPFNLLPTARAGQPDWYRIWDFFFVSTFYQNYRASVQVLKVKNVFFFNLKNHTV